MTSEPKTTLNKPIPEDILNDISKLKPYSLDSGKNPTPSREECFKKLVFYDPNQFENWKRAFPDPEKSPAQFVLHLSFYYSWTKCIDDPEASRWIQAFTNVKNLNLDFYQHTKMQTIHTSLQNLKTVKSLRLTSANIHSSIIYNFICSFPLLEDLDISYPKGGPNGTPMMDTTMLSPNTSPPLTGTLVIRENADHVASLVSKLPCGLHFKEIDWKTTGEIPPMSALVEKCSNTLERIRINLRVAYGGFHLFGSCGRFDV